MTQARDESSIPFDAPASEPPAARTLGELRASAWHSRSVRDEIRTNLIAALREGRRVFEGIVGYEQTVIPQVINALLSRHNIILLGLRGQAKTRLMRQVAKLLDEWMPIVAGSDIHDDPYQPVSWHARELVAEKKEATPIEWVHRGERYREKLATPDVSVADLVGDIDPVKAATQKLHFGHEAVINFGIIPRTNRGIFGINELPDLQPRIQVSLFNILEEKDVQIRGFPVRLPMDILLMFTANPEDYTNRGSIITPLKDRIESQILTHYPAEVSQAMQITDQEAWTTRSGEIEVVMPLFLRRVVDRMAFAARDSEYVDQASGVSARLPIAALENVVSNVERRAVMQGKAREFARVVDLQAALPAITGKLELVYEGEQEGPFHVATNLVGQALRQEFELLFPSAYKPTSPRQRKPGPGPEREPDEESDLGEYKPIIDHFAGSRTVELTDTLTAEEYRARLTAVPGLEDVVRAHLDPGDDNERLAAMEFVLEGLHQSSLLAKEDIDRGILYCDMLGSMMADF